MPFANHVIYWQQPEMFLCWLFQSRPVCKKLIKLIKCYITVIHKVLFLIGPKWSTYSGYRASPPIKEKLRNKYNLSKLDCGGWRVKGGTKPPSEMCHQGVHPDEILTDKKEKQRYSKPWCWGGLSAVENMVPGAISLKKGRQRLHVTKWAFICEHVSIYPFPVP